MRKNGRIRGGRSVFDDLHEERASGSGAAERLPRLGETKKFEGIGGEETAGAGERELRPQGKRDGIECECERHNAGYCNAKTSGEIAREQEMTGK
jgi:hypothetical protein